MGLNKKALGNRIKEARKTAQVTAETLAEKCNKSYNHIRHIEGGSRVPSLELFVTICSKMNVSPQYLLQDSVSITELDELDIMIGKVKSQKSNHIKAIEKVIKIMIDDLF
jgi:transcriptional regulator with XRE-family HTH domain